jgi:hypothetical protein
MLTSNTPLNNVSHFLQNFNLSYRFKDLKSGNLSFLPDERNSRLVDSVNTRKTNLNYSSSQNNLNELIESNVKKSLGNSQSNLFLSANLN